MILVIDDTRTLSLEGEVVHARTVREAMKVIEYARLKERPLELYLDHDLGTTNIRPFVYVLANTPDRFEFIETINVHSMNPIGAQWITDILQPYYRVKRITPKELKGIISQPKEWVW